MIEVALVLDRSGSMAYADNEPAVYPPIPAAAPYDWDFGDPAPNLARWRNAVVSVEAFLTELNKSSLNERVSLVTSAFWGALLSEVGAASRGRERLYYFVRSGGRNRLRGSIGMRLFSAVKLFISRLSSLQSRPFSSRLTGDGRTGGTQS